MKKSLIILVLISMLILTSCAGECKKDTDCNRAHFTAKCIDKKCNYVPLPNECGNLQCDSKEDKCTCPQDCGQCTGKVPNSLYLSQQCVDKQCIESVQENLVKQTYTTAEITSAGDKFGIETTYNQPFNLKKDLFTVTLTLKNQAPANSETHILNAELTATTKDKRTITLATQNIDKYMWSGTSITEDIIFDFPAETESELTNVMIKINYEYAITQSGKKTTKQATIQNKYKEKLVYVNPAGTYPCPTTCDDKNMGTRDYCSIQTNSFCKHEPIPNACGNFKCDGNENKCTCPQDCGPCTGSAGNYLDYKCEMNKCVTILKPGTTTQPNKIFDDRSLGPVQLHNNYIYNTPFNVNKDEITLEFKIYRQDPTVSDFKIETIRILEGTQQLADATINEILSEEVKTFKIKIPKTTNPEEEHQITIGVWYKYEQNGEKTGKYEKQLGKITLINT